MSARPEEKSDWAFRSKSPEISSFLVDSKVFIIRSLRAASFTVWYKAMNGGVVSIRFNSPLNLHSSKLGSGWNEKMFLTNYSGRAYALHTLPFSL